jgi:hypothetical protein
MVFRISILTILLICTQQTAKSQGLIETMATQLAKLELYLQELKQGYSIVQKGLNTISEIKKGDLDLHSRFFNSLTDVKPAIKNWGKVADIVAMEIQILQGTVTTANQFAQTGTFSQTDLAYISSVYSNLKSLTLTDIDEVTGLITDGNWQMSDDERMSRIDQLFNRVREKYVFLHSFADRTFQISQARQREKGSLENIISLLPK